MGDYGHVVSWRGIRSGREKQALEVWGEALELYEKGVANSKIESYETVLFEPSAGGLPIGMTIVWGSQDQIDTWTRDEDRVRVQAKASLTVEGLAVARCARGQVVAEGVGQFVELINNL
jgi:hypothetical protein